ncbi:hypothetical protein [Micropruina sp.]|uniref:hypothetical protein n=1 Tax=Micropruina sp. TaxID=2737536 RepID=UPI0039E2D6B4
MLQVLRPDSTASADAVAAEANAMHRIEAVTAVDREIIFFMLGSGRVSFVANIGGSHEEVK